MGKERRKREVTGTLLTRWNMPRHLNKRRQGARVRINKEDITMLLAKHSEAEGSPRGQGHQRQGVSQGCIHLSWCRQDSKLRGPPTRPRKKKTKATARQQGP